MWVRIDKLLDGRARLPGRHFPFSLGDKVLAPLPYLVLWSGWDGSAKVAADSLRVTFCDRGVI